MHRSTSYHHWIGGVYLITGVKEDDRQIPWHVEEDETLELVRERLGESLGAPSCVCVRVCVRACVRAYVRACVCVYSFMCGSLQRSHLGGYIYVYNIYIYTHTHILYIYIHTYYVCMYVYMYVCIRVHIYKGDDNNKSLDK